jgi:hypothetical protein
MSTRRSSPVALAVREKEVTAESLLLGGRTTKVMEILLKQYLLAQCALQKIE